MDKISDLNLVGMLSWVHNVPNGSNKIFKDQLDLLPKDAKLLEVGTYVGASIIEMLNYLPKSKATVIDNWSISKEEMDYGDVDLEDVFYNNIIKANVKDRIDVMDGRSSDMLAMLIEDHKTFDFIYVDASHKSLDVYSDLILSWKLLDINGILAIDDYLWQISNDPFENPKNGIDHFLNQYYSEYYILHKDYRVFLKKIPHHDVISLSSLKIRQNLKKDKPLLNVLFMVKDSGDNFRDIIKQNKPFMDRWTILDTGSTDNTIQIIKEELSDIPGNLYEEPFINFRDSRNRLLELAGNSCEFNVMLDDTYVIHGDLRGFLELAKCDDTFDSYSINIFDNEIIYQSNRVTKTSRSLKYVNIVHETIQEENNHHGLIPEVFIEDKNSDYMLIRTNSRKHYDLELLMKEYKADKNPRTLYYIGSTYLGLKEWALAYKYFKKRGYKQGYLDEKSDALYYKAALATFYLNKKWDKCFRLWRECFNNDNKRTEALYFIADHFYKENDKDRAWEFIYQAFQIGIPRPTISFRKNIHHYEIPKLTALLAFSYKEYDVGLEACKKALEFKQDSTLLSYLPLYELYTKRLVDVKLDLDLDENKKNIVFIAPYGWDTWNGNTYYSQGLGGSETFAVKYGEYIHKHGYNVIVFCNTEKVTTCEGVYYIPLDYFLNYLMSYKTHACIINRAPEYSFLALEANIQKVYLVFHDVIVPNMIVPTNITKVFLLSEWHRNQFLEYFPLFKDKADIISHGIELDKLIPTIKTDYSFIYSSFANRGLLPLLKVFPKIVERYPKANLEIFCDLENSWLNQHYGDQVKEIKKLITDQREYVTNNGFANKAKLNLYWRTSHVWLYPNNWDETFCVTALEAAASKTLIISNNRAGLADSISDRGQIMINDFTEEDMLKAVDDILSDESKQQLLINKSYKYALSKSYDEVVNNFLSNYINE